MKYEDFIENYTPELQLSDALDRLRTNPFAAAETLDLLVSRSNNEKIDVEPPQIYPIPKTFAQDTQLLSPEWEHQYTSQQDSTNISLTCNGEEQKLEYPYQVQKTYPVPSDVYLSLDLPLTSKLD